MRLVFLLRICVIALRTQRGSLAVATRVCARVVYPHRVPIAAYTRSQSRGLGVLLKDPALGLRAASQDARTRSHPARLFSILVYTLSALPCFRFLRLLEFSVALQHAHNALREFRHRSWSLLEPSIASAAIFAPPGIF